MLKQSVAKGTQVEVCGTCAAARGIKNVTFVKGAELSTMAELTEYITDSVKVLTF